jgi:mannose-6-phosphate isomerase-like protein (cupin superfamily)
VESGCAQASGGIADRYQPRHRSAAARDHDLGAALDVSQHRCELGAKGCDGKLSARHVQNVHLEPNLRNEGIPVSKPGDVANRFLFENERVRVWRMDLAPGEASDFHEHTLPYVLCILEGESIDADLEDGRTLHIPVEAGRVFFVPPGSRETAVNRSPVRFREILIELKG